MSPELTFRDATAEDLDVLATLYEAVDRPGVNTRESMQAAWQRLRAEVPGARVLLALFEGEPVGSFTCFVLPLLAHGGAPEMVIEDVVVQARMQGRGVGRAMMNEAMRIAREAGCYKLALSSNLKRTQAHAFYERLGFARHGVSFVVEPPA